ncbi:hypothetical protein ACG873_30055 [Mesorhizobium sp. AaZ16]|uniref:hypothetical protein n=1 Tax=Mesorhizobium sp. AaZ16 TaxID=3402289 RepID=UPI00374F5787
MNRIAETAMPECAGWRLDIASAPPLAATVDLGPVSLTRDSVALRHCDDGCSFIISLEGRFDAVFGDTRVSLTPGRATLVPHYKPGGMISAVGGKSFTLRFDRDAARVLSPSLDDLVLKETVPGDPAIAVLSAYCAQLVALPGGVPAGLARLASLQLRELVAHIVNPASDLARPRRSAG